MVDDTDKDELGSQEQRQGASDEESTAGATKKRAIGRIKLAKRRVQRTAPAAAQDVAAEAPDGEIARARALDALAAGRPNEALRFCHEARKVGPNDVDLAATEVWIRAHLTRPDLKVRELELGMLILDAPSSASARYYRGCVRLRLGQDTAAKQDFEQVLALDPGHAGARGRLEMLRK